MTQNGINQAYYTACGGFGLPGITYVNANQVVSSSGQNQIYTVPSGRRALISRVDCNAQSNVTANCCFNNGGTYYNGGGPQTSLTAGTPKNLISTIPLILDAGEILSIALSSALSVNVWPQIIEFDADSALKSGKFLNAAAGNNLVYTVPAGKTMIALDKVLNHGGASATGFGNLSSSTQMYWLYVPNGQSVGPTFRISNTATPSGGATTGGTMVQSATRFPSMNAGDMIYVNANAATGGCAYFNYLEIPV